MTSPANGKPQSKRSKPRAASARNAAGTVPKHNGRPPKIPTASQIRQVEEMAARGLTQEDMSAVLGVSVPTFRKYVPRFFAAAIAKGKAVGKNTVGAALMRQIKRGNVTAIIWYEKSRCGYTEKTHTVHTDADGNPLPAPLPGVSVGIFLPPNGRDVPGAALVSAFPEPPAGSASVPV